MKAFAKYILGGIVTLLIVLILMLFSSLFFYLQDKQMLEKEKTIEIAGVDVKDSDLLLMTIDEKINMLNPDRNTESVKLKTGDIYSLYEARKQCFKELSKIPSLEIELYGPIYEEIDVRPYLIINSEIPSQTMLVWMGQLKIKDVSYYVVLDEESGKLIKLESDEWNNNEFKKTVLKEWKNYLKST